MKIKKYTNGAWTDLDKPVKKFATYTDEATTLPLTIEASATDAVENYQVYGASGGVGKATSGDEPQGYKIPLLISDTNSHQSNYDLFIGDTQLAEDEYLDYQEQKVYKRTENLFDKSTAILGKEIQGSNIVDNADWAITPLIPVEPQSYYSILGFGVARLEYMSENDNNPTRTAASSQNPTLSTTHFIRLNLAISNLTTATIVSGSTEPTTYIPYYNPIDPPVPFPTIQTYIGENSLSVDTTVQPEKVACEYQGWKGVGDVEKYQNGEWSDNNGT